MQRLAAYLRVASRRLPPEGHEPRRERLSLGGEVGIDGIQGWGNVPEHDWFQPPPDEVPDGSGWGVADIRTTATLLAWLRTEGGETADDGAPLDRG